MARRRFVVVMGNGRSLVVGTLAASVTGVAKRGETAVATVQFAGCGWG